MHIIEDLSDDIDEEGACFSNSGKYIACCKSNTNVEIYSI